MKITRFTRRFLFISLLTVLAPIVLCAPQAYAETYVGGQFGLSMPSIGKGLSNGELTSRNVTFPTGTATFPEGTTIDNQSLASSLLVGIKLGHFFSRAPWLGIETELFQTTPHIKQQDITIRSDSPVTFTPAGGGPPTLINTPLTSPGFQGANFRVITWAPLNFVFRYPGTRLQPYVAIGPGVFFGRIKDGSITQGPDSQSSTKIGLNTQVGLQYYITRHVSMFGEWKYNYTRFNFQENDNFFGFKSTYSMHLFAVGINYHF